MSLRQFYPRKNLRRQVASWKLFILYATLLVAIGLQISYPLIDGEPLRVVTIATVYWAAAAMFIHASLAYGFVYSIQFLFITFSYALVVEQIGSRSGWPFGSYEYSPTLGYQIYGVPLVVPFAWVMLAHPVLLAARKSHVPFQPEIPLSNAFGWLLTGMGLMAILNVVLRVDRRKVSTSTAVPDFFLMWTWFACVVGNLFFFDRTGVAFLGGLVFGLFLLPYIFLLRFGPPANN